MHGLFSTQMKEQFLCVHAKKCVGSTNNIHHILMLHNSEKNNP